MSNRDQQAVAEGPQHGQSHGAERCWSLVCDCCTAKDTTIAHCHIPVAYHRIHRIHNVRSK
jgi:hypothetical protein